MQPGKCLWSTTFLYVALASGKVRTYGFSGCCLRLEGVEFRVNRFQKSLFERICFRALVKEAVEQQQQERLDKLLSMGPETIFTQTAQASSSAHSSHLHSHPAAKLTHRNCKGAWNCIQHLLRSMSVCSCRL